MANFYTNPKIPFESIDPADFRKWYPKDRTDLVAENTFEIGLVMAGAVSAGAYTAGVMDFLFQALDAWEQAKREHPDATPNHKSIVKIITGASAGGMNGAITAVASRYQFPHITSSSESTNGDANPFYKSWVKDVDIGDLLVTSDIDGQGGIKSALNASVLDKTVESIINWKAPKANLLNRQWLDDNLVLKLTLSNLKGVPYKVRFTSTDNKLNYNMMSHGDQIAFTVPVHREISPGESPPDHIDLPLNNNLSIPQWSSLGTVALATGAFPLALQSREIWKSTTDFEYRFAYINSADEKIYAKPWPDGNGPEILKYGAIDGGVFDNQPFEVARSYLSGSNGKNPRTGKEANRAILMIDPFSEPPLGTVTEEADLSIMGAIKRIIGSSISQSNFKQIDLSLAAAADVYSRFLIAPTRYSISGDRAMASGGLEGFAGFFHEAYRHHDFMLGRANCQRFLRDWFVLPKDNPLFSNGSDALKTDPRYQSKSPDRSDHLQIIPLVGDLIEEQEIAPWPVNQLSSYQDFKAPIESRCNKLIPKLIVSINSAEGSGVLNKLRNFLVRLYLFPMVFVLKKRMLKMIEEQLDTAIADINKGRPDH